MKSKSEGTADWNLTIRQLPLAGFESTRWLTGVGWTLTIRRLPPAGFESDGMRRSHSAQQAAQRVRP
jgi:hypothetical protein